MRCLGIGALVWLCVGSYAFGNTGEVNSTPPTQPSAILYQALIAQVQSGKTDIDYTALRLSYAKTDGYDPWGTTTQKSFMESWTAFQNDDCTTAMKAVQVVLASDFTRIPMHAVLQTCLEKAGDKQHAGDEFAIGKGLSDSLLHSGDGKSQATAYIVISLKEEGYVLSSLGCRETLQALIMGQGHAYDALTCTDEKTGTNQNVLFQIDTVMAGEAKMFSKKE